MRGGKYRDALRADAAVTGQARCRCSKARGPFHLGAFRLIEAFISDLTIVFGRGPPTCPARDVAGAFVLGALVGTLFGLVMLVVRLSVAFTGAHAPIDEFF